MDIDIFNSNMIFIAHFVQTILSKKNYIAFKINILFYLILEIEPMTLPLIIRALMFAK